MRPLLAAFVLLLPTLPAVGQALAPPPAPRSAAGASRGDGYGAFTPAPTPGVGPAGVAPVDRAGTPGDSGGPLNSTPFSGAPASAYPRDGGQISPALRDTSPGNDVLPSLSR